MAAGVAHSWKSFLTSGKLIASVARAAASNELEEWMPTFTLQFEHYEQRTAFVEVEAEDLNAAIELASEVDPHILDWEETGDGPVDARLYAVADVGGQTLATVALPDISQAFSWTHVDLREQWDRAGGGGPDQAVCLALSEALPAYFRALAPVISDDAQTQIARTALQKATDPASGEGGPIRI